MKSIGLFTGNVYETIEEVQNSKECCQQIDHDPDPWEIAKIKLACLSCPGDPECLKGKINN